MAECILYTALDSHTTRSGFPDLGTVNSTTHVQMVMEVNIHWFKAKTLKYKDMASSSTLYIMGEHGMLPLCLSTETGNIVMSYTCDMAFQCSSNYEWSEWHCYKQAPCRHDLCLKGLYHRRVFAVCLHSDPESYEWGLSARSVDLK